MGLNFIQSKSRHYLFNCQASSLSTVKLKPIYGSSCESFYNSDMSMEPEHCLLTACGCHVILIKQNGHEAVRDRLLHYCSNVSLFMRKPAFHMRKKVDISCWVTAQLISAFGFVTYICR